MPSEKAKGKQRAIEPFNDENEGQSSSSSRVGEIPLTPHILVRFTDGAPDVSIMVDKKSSVQDMKQRIRRLRPELQHRHLRLIHSGRLLTHSVFHAWFTSLDQQQHQQLKKSDDDNGDKGPISLAKPSTIWIHCSIGQVLTAGDSEDDENLQKIQIQPIRGFDRLVSVGFSQQDVDSMRRQFHSQSSTNYLDHDFETDEDYVEHARALEEQWMESMDNPGTALSQSSITSGPSILQGVLVGFFFPLIPFFFMRTPKPAVFWEDGSQPEVTASALYSRRTAMGIVIGFLGNILFGIWRYLLES